MKKISVFISRKPGAFTRRGFFALGFCLLAAAPGCNVSFGKNKDKEEDNKIPYVEAVTVQAGPVALTLTGTSVLRPEREVEIFAEIEGTVKSVAMQEGARVAEGAALAQLDSEEKRLLVEQARIKAGNAKRELERNKELFEKNLLSAVDFERLDYQARLAQAELEVASHNLSKASLRAPIPGILTWRGLEPGQTVKPGQMVFKIADVMPMEALIYLPEKDAGRVREGQKAGFAMDADAGVVFEGRVARISPVVDPATGTIKITLQAEKVPSGARAGAFVRVFLKVDERPKAILVPKKAILQSGEQSEVFVLQPGNRVKKTPVETGYERDDLIEIRKGVQASDRVVTLGKEVLQDGAEVQVAVSPSASR
jgi:membrane fusion protein (multidrug efflux system)